MFFPLSDWLFLLPPLKLLFHLARRFQIDDIAFELFAINCGIERGIRQKKIPQEKLLSRKYNKPIVSRESPINQNAFVFPKCDIVY